MITLNEVASASDPLDLSGRTALVTGGTVSIGRAIALALARAGADLALHGSRAADQAFGQPDAAEEAEGAIRNMGRRVACIESDLAPPGAGKEVFRQAEAALGAIDILVVCASIQRHQRLEDITRDALDQQCAINFSASIELLQAALPAMRARGWGRVLSIGSVNQLRPHEDLVVYAALKAAQHNVVRGLARQYAPYGVTINTLSPGLIATERNRARRDNPEQWLRQQREANPMSRAGTPEDVAAAALLLCAPGSRFITGVDLAVDGGRHL